MSPEQIQEQRYNEKSDIWSAGCCIYEMSCLKAPFEATNQIQLAYKIKLGKIDRIPEVYSDELQQVISSMISVEQNRRPSVENLMMHPRVCYVIKQLEVKRKEADVVRKGNDVQRLEETLRERTEKYEKRQKEYEEKQEKIKQLEESLKRRETQLTAQKHRIANQSELAAQQIASGRNKMVNETPSNVLQKQLAQQKAQEDMFSPETVVSTPTYPVTEETIMSNMPKVPEPHQRPNHDLIQPEREIPIHEKKPSQEISDKESQENDQQRVNIHLNIHKQSSRTELQPQPKPTYHHQSTKSSSLADRYEGNNGNSQSILDSQEETKEDKEEVKKSSHRPPSAGGGLLSGIEAQRQKLQELKRGLNQNNPQNNFTNGMKATPSGQSPSQRAGAPNARQNRPASSGFQSGNYITSPKTSTSYKANSNCKASPNYKASPSYKASPKHGHQFSGHPVRQRSNSASKSTLPSAVHNPSNYPSSSQLNRVRSNSRDYLHSEQQQQRHGTGLNHGSSAQRSTGKLGEQVQMPKQNAGLIKRNVSGTGQNRSGSRNRYEQVPSYLTQRPKTGNQMSQERIGGPPPIHGRAQKYPNYGSKNNYSYRNQPNPNERQINQTQQHGRYQSPLTGQNANPTVARAAANYAMNQQNMYRRDSSGSRYNQQEMPQSNRIMHQRGSRPGSASGDLSSRGMPSRLTAQHRAGSPSAGQIQGHLHTEQQSNQGLTTNESQKNLRSALEEITQRIQSKYLQQ